MVCCDQLPALFSGRMESDLLFFCRSHLAIRSGSGGGLLGVCWSCLLRSSSLFFPMQQSKTPPQLHRQRGEKKMNGEANKAPHWKPRPATFTHVIFSNNEGKTTPRATFNGNGRPTKHWICGRLQNTLCKFSLEVKGHHLHPPQDPNLQLLSCLHKFGSTGWI